VRVPDWPGVMVLTSACAEVLQVEIELAAADGGAGHFRICIVLSLSLAVLPLDEEASERDVIPALRSEPGPRMDFAGCRPGWLHPFEGCADGWPSRRTPVAHGGSLTYCTTNCAAMPEANFSAGV